MNELQKYVDSLPMFLSEAKKIELIEQWKKDNNWGKEDQSTETKDFAYGGETTLADVLEDVKTEGDAAGAGAEPVPTTAPTGTGFGGETGSSDLLKKATSFNANEFVYGDEVTPSDEELEGVELFIKKEKREKKQKKEEEEREIAITTNATTEAEQIFNSTLESKESGRGKSGINVFRSENSSKDFNQQMSDSFIAENKIIQEQVIPKATKETDAAVLVYAKQLQEEYGLTNPDSFTQEKYDEYLKDVENYYNTTLNSKIAQNKDFQILTSAFDKKASELSQDYSKAITRKENKPYVNIFGRSYDLNLPEGGALEAIYRGFVNIDESLKGLGRNLSTNESANRNKHFERNFKNAQAYNWTDETVGYFVDDPSRVNDSMRFNPKNEASIGIGTKYEIDGKQYNERQLRDAAKRNNLSFSDYIARMQQEKGLKITKAEGIIPNYKGGKEITWGEFKKLKEKNSSERTATLQGKLKNALEEQVIAEAFNYSEFDKITEGVEISKNVTNLVAGQLPNMLAAFFTLGGFTGLTIGSDIYADSIDNRARELRQIEAKKQGIVLSEQELYAPITAEEQLAVISDEKWNDNAITKASLGGFVGGQLERIGAAKAFKPFATKTIASILRGNAKKVIKNAAISGGNATKAGLSESATEFGQTLVQDVASGNKIEAKNYVESSGTGLIVGTVLGGFGSAKTQTVAELKTVANVLAGKLNAKSSEAIFNAEVKKINDLAKIEKDPEAKKDLLAKRNAILEVRNANNKIPSNISEKNKKEALDLLIEKESLTESIKGKDPDLVDAAKSRLKDINERLKVIGNEAEVKARAAKVEKGARIIAEQVGTGFETFENEADMASAIETLKEQGGKVDIKNSQDYGSFVVMPDGKRIIILNKESAAQDNVMDTAGHEVGHVVLFETVKNNPEAAIALGSSLLEELKNSKDITFTNSRFLDRFNQYVEDTDISKADTMEEVLTLASEGLANGDIVFNEKASTKIGDFIRRALSAMGLNVKFKTGKDVLNFVRDYNRSIQKGKGLSKGLEKAATKGAKVDIKVPTEIETKVTEIVSKESKKDTGVEASTKVQEIYEAQGVDGAFDIIEQFKPIVSRIVEKRSEAPNFDRQLLTDEIETGKRGILDLIKEYKPESGVPLAAYVNKFLPARSIEASQRVLGEEFTTDVTEAKGVAAEEVTTEVSTKPVTRKIKPSSFISKDAVTQIKEQIQEKIKDIDPKNLTFKKIGDLAPEIIAEEIGIPVKKLTVPAANLSKGDATAIQQFVNKNADKLLKILPQGAVVEAATDKLLGTSTGVPKGLLDAFYTKKTRLTKGAGLSPFVLNKGITKAKFLEAFGIVDGKKQEGFNARSSQAQALKGIANLYGKLVTNEIVRSDTDLSLEAKQDVAAGKSKSMASKRITTEAEMSPKLKKLFVEISQAKNINQALSTIGVDAVSINDSNRIEKQKSFQNAIEKFKLDLNTFLAGSFAASGAVRSRSSNGDVYYSLSNGERILGTRVIENGEQKVNKDGKKMFNQPTLDAISKKFGQDVTLVASRGRLYYGATDPAYIKAKLAAEKNTKDNKFKAAKIGLPPGIETKITKEFINKKAAQSKMNMNVLDSVVTQLSEAVANGMPIEVAATIITQGYQATSGLIKIAAPFKYASSNFFYALNGKKSDRTGKKYREEHNPPASVVGASIILAIKNNAAKPTMDALRENYYQTQLSKSDDTKIDQAKLASTTVDGQTIFNNPISRLAAAGIDLQTLINPLTGKTIAQESGFGIDPKVYNKYNANEKLQASSIQNEAILEGLKNPDLDVASKIKASLPLVPGKSMASKRDSDLIPDAIKYDRPIAVQTAINALEKTDKALGLARKLDQPVKKIRVFDFDDTLARSKSMVIVNMPDGSSRKINATQFAQQASDLESQGAEFDFTEFSKVVEGKKGPLFEVAQKIADARGTEDVFILTARPQNADGPIKAFMKANGIDIPLKNITGLGDGTAEAKAGWIMGKAAEGYNDFYFADDAIKNVKAVKDVLSQIDVKSEVQLAKASKRTTFDTIVNDMIEDSSGIAAYKQYSAARAKTVGANKGKFNFFIPASAEDFTGLLYKMLGNGKRGDAQMAFLKTNLLDPYDRAESAVTQAKIAAANDFKALKENLKTLPKSLSKPTGIGGFTFSHAVRVAVWSKQGMTIPGLSKKDIKELNDFVNNNSELSVFTDELMKIQKGKPYPKPGDNWLGGNITSDIINDINKVNRAEYQQEWRENVDIIFSEDNMNKMEAAYGTRWREAMEDSLRRMKSGSNRPPGGNRVTDGLLDWLNNSVGAVMFLNTRSALLQTISSVNFINWGDNNIVKAGLAFANQKQFWSDFMTLMNSDYLVERRNGLKINVSESEIADAVRDSKNKVKSAIAFLLSKGFVMTRFADSFAIATGGSTFYRNRVKALVAKGMDQKAAEKQAFDDFRQIAEESQQSSNPNRISAQQASGAGRVILAWANTPMQYARIQKRAAQDLINKRGDWKTNVSKIVYYGAIQNLIFNALQQAVFALGFGEDDDEEKQDAKKNEKIARIANGMIDSQLKGLGIGGAAVVALKSALMELGKQHAKDRSKYEEAVFDLLGFSPPLGSKIQKINSGLRSFSWNMKDIKSKGFSLDNPAYLAGAQITTGLTNVPFDRVIKKLNSMRGIVNEQSALWQKVALGLGWSTWDVGLGYYGGFDAAQVLTPEEQAIEDVNTMKKETKTKEQVDMLLDLGLTKKEIKALGKEQQRVEKIIELQKEEVTPEVKSEVKPESKVEEVKKESKQKTKPKKESSERRLRRQFDSIKDENKPEQVKTLLDFGLSKKQIRALQYEKNRVEKILELMYKNKKK